MKTLQELTQQQSAILLAANVEKTSLNIVGLLSVFTLVAALAHTINMNDQTNTPTAKQALHSQSVTAQKFHL
jgi:hypothetical protein